MSDLIDRQAAIDAVMETEPYLGTENIVYQRTDDVVANINKLPSVQPERKTSEWLHEIFQDAIDAGIITETQAARIMDLKEGSK